MIKDFMEEMFYEISALKKSSEENLNSKK